MFYIILLMLGVLACGVYSLAMKPASMKFSGKGDTILFNAFVTLTASVCAFISFAAQGGETVPLEGLIWAAIFGVIFSMTVFTNLIALEHGPLSLTTLIVNFSLVQTILFFAIFYNEKLSPIRIIGIAILVFCMFLYTNPKIQASEKNRSKREMFTWLILSVIAAVGNGFLSITQKIYSMKSDNAYAASFLAFGYLFATVTSAILFAIIHIRSKKEKRTNFRGFFSLPMIGFILLMGFSNYILNLIVVILATKMDAAIVYPVIQGGGPIIVTVGSRLLFKEKITASKAMAILLGCSAIVLLNL